MGTKWDAEGFLSTCKPWGLCFRVSHDPKPRGDTLGPQTLATFQTRQALKHCKVCILALSEETIRKLVPQSRNKNMRVLVKTNYQQISQSWTPGQNKVKPQALDGESSNSPSFAAVCCPPTQSQRCPGTNKEDGGWASGTYFHSNFQFKLCSNPLGPSEWHGASMLVTACIQGREYVYVHIFKNCW